MENTYGVHLSPETVLSPTQMETFNLRKKLQAQNQFEVSLSLDGQYVVILNSQGKLIMAEGVRSLG